MRGFVAAGRGGARLAAGPLVLWGFFLPWAHGSGVLAGSDFSGFDLVGFAGRVEQLDLGPFVGGGLWLLRALVLGVVVAAAWLTLLAPLPFARLVYRLSGAYLALTGGALLLTEIARADLSPAPAGLLLWLAGAALFLLASTLDVLQARRQRAPKRPAAHAEAFTDALAAERLHAP